MHPARLPPRTVLVVCEQLGENSTSPHDPVRPFDPANPPDLSATISVCFSSDFDLLVEKARFSVAEIAVPAWMDAATYCQHSVRVKYASAAVGLDAPERLFRWAMGARFADAYAVGKLMATKTFRSEFRAKLAAQVTTWCAADPETSYASPLSPRQIDAIARFTDLDARRTESSLYASRTYPGRELSASEVAALATRSAA